MSLMSEATTRFLYTMNTEAAVSRHRLLITIWFWANRIRYASRPAYLALYRLSSMFHSMKDFMYTPNFTPEIISSRPQSFGSTNVFAIRTIASTLYVVAREDPFERVPRIAAVSRFCRNSLMIPSLYRYRRRAFTPSSSYA